MASILTVGLVAAGAPAMQQEEFDTLPAYSRVVVIDAGHGGHDPGAVGISGVLEKTVALGVALNLAIELDKDPTIAVHMTRDRDVFVDVWQRGELATAWKGRKPGVFVSLHANSLPADTMVQGFETYFLSEARTEHERRVAAIENAPPPIEGSTFQVQSDDELAGILRELLNLDHHHWSAVLAEDIQDAMAAELSAPSLGVRQAPLAVITNTLMPGVLVELGYLTSREEEARLDSTEYQRSAAVALARGIRAFLDRYPPGQHARGSGRP